MSRRGQLVKSLADYPQAVDQVAFLARMGKRILTRCFNQIQIRDLASGLSQTNPLHLAPAGVPASAADGETGLVLL